MGKMKSLAVAMAIMAASTSVASAACNHRDVVMEELREKYGEMVVSRGLAVNNHVVEVLASKDGSSWTIVHTNPNNLFTCAMASGSDWESDTKPDYSELNGQEN